MARLVKQAPARASLDPERYSGHSLRADLATAAGEDGANLADVMRQIRHKSTQVALAYLRPADLWRNNVTQRVFGAETDGTGGNGRAVPSRTRDCRAGWVHEPRKWMVERGSQRLRRKAAR